MKLTKADVQGLPPIILDKDGLQEMFDLYTEMFKSFKDVQGLPDYPIDLNTRKGQLVIREIFGFLIEEMAEAESEWANVYAVSKIHTFKPMAKEQILGIENFNEELVDVMHLMIQLMLYSNIDASSIKSYYAALAKEHNLQAITFPDHTLATALSVAQFTNGQTGMINWETGNGVQVGNKEDLMGTAISIRNAQIVCALFWQMTAQLAKAMNCLKNKPWKKTNTDTDIPAYHENLMQAWQTMFMLLSFLGGTDQMIFGHFWYKNQINILRQKQK